MVRQLQLRWLDQGAADDMAAPTKSQMTELRDRVARLRRLGSRYADVRLSRYVTLLRETAMVEG